MIVFVNSKRACDIVYKQLDTLGYRCTVLHSGKTQARAPPAPAQLRGVAWRSGAAKDGARRVGAAYLLGRSAASFYWKC